MKIGFVVETKDGQWPFLIDTERLPYSIGNAEIVLKNFREVKFTDEYGSQQSHEILLKNTRVKKNSQ